MEKAHRRKIRAKPSGLLLWKLELPPKLTSS